MGSWLSRAILLLSLLAGTPAGATGTADPGRQAFAEATQAFHDGNMPLARKLFMQARDAGIDTPTLHYNLGVTHYRLQHYADAEREFRSLLAAADTAPVANYNLGLIALRRGNNDEARVFFTRTRDAETTPQLQQLALTALARLDKAQQHSRVQGAVTLGAGYDDNVALTPEADATGVSNRGDSFAEVIAAARVRLSGTADNGLRLDAGGLLRTYSDLSAYNLQAGRVGLARYMPLDEWAGLAGMTLDTVYLDGQRFQNLATLTLEASRSLDQGRRLLLRLGTSRVDGGDDYDYLTGWRQRLGAEISWPVQRQRWAMGYELELNDRRDSRQGAEFFSQSPQRHSLYAELRAPVTPRLNVSARMEIRRSDYSGMDVHIESSGTQRAGRKDSQWQAALQASYRIDARWQAFARYTHTNNDANFNSLSYRRNEAQAGVEMRF